MSGKEGFHVGVTDTSDVVVIVQKDGDRVKMPMSLDGAKDLRAAVESAIHKARTQKARHNRDDNE